MKKKLAGMRIMHENIVSQSTCLRLDESFLRQSWIIAARINRAILFTNIERSMEER